MTVADADAFFRLANACFMRGDAGSALQHIEAAIDCQPDRAILHANRGLILHYLGRLSGALASYDRAVALMPENADFENGRGSVLLALGHAAAAVASYDRTIALAPSRGDAYYNRGNALRASGRPEAALAAYDDAIARGLNLVEVHTNRGLVLQDLNRHDDALASFDRALQLKPDSVVALNGRGLSLQALDRIADAIGAFTEAIRAAPDRPEAYFNRGNVLLLATHYEPASDDLTRALALDPQHHGAAAYLLYARLQCCDWRDYRAGVDRAVAAVRAGESGYHPFAFLSISNDPADQLRCAQIHLKSLDLPATPAVWRGAHDRHDRIRVGYLSANLYDHALAHLAVGVFEHHDRARFEVTAYSFGPNRPGPMRQRLEAAFEHFVDVGQQSDREVAAQLRAREIDIAVDLMGLTADARPGILALRSAPAQISFLGYTGSTGAAFIDYIMADRCVVPEADRKFFTEHVIYLPDTYFATDDRQPIADPTPRRAEVGLPEPGVVFCCFNQAGKITPDFFDVWMRLLRAVPESVLWLLANVSAERNLLREAERHGVVANRLVFAPRLTTDRHLARHRLADIFLDTLPYNAHTTASDALWAGVPVVTCRGRTFAGRVAASQLHAVGLSELIAGSLAEYEALALRLARDPAALAAIKAKLARQRTSAALFDTARFTRNLEAAYEEIVQRSRNGKPPESFAILPTA
jgi:protein O-GlcNAc transferase